MKKTTLLLSVMLFVALCVHANVFITELADPNNNAAVRYIELYNSGLTDVDFTEGSGWRIDKYTNEHVTVSQTLPLTGTILAGDFYIIATGSDDGEFYSIFSVNADQFDNKDNDVAGSNGDDNLELYNGNNELVDQFGNPGTDGTGTNYEFEDGRAERKGMVMQGNASYTFAEWSVWNDSGDSGTTNAPQDAPGDFDPRNWIGLPTDTLPEIADLFPLMGSRFEGDSTFIISATVTTADADGVDSVCFAYGVAQDALDDTLKMEANVDTFYIPMSASEPGAYYGQVIVYGGNGERALSSVLEVIVEVPQFTTLPYFEEFADTIGSAYLYSEQGDEVVWTLMEEYGIELNPILSDEMEEDWIIFPSMDLDKYFSTELSFGTMYSDGLYNGDNYLKVVYSSDYKGVGSPMAVDWTELECGLSDLEADSIYDISVDIDSVEGQGVVFAFLYNYNVGSYRHWKLGNVSVIGVDTGSVAPQFEDVYPDDNEWYIIGDTANLIASVVIPTGVVDSVLFVYGEPVIDSVAMYFVDDSGYYWLPLPISFDGELLFKFVAYGNGERVESSMRAINGECGFLESPLARLATPVSSHSFTANWDPVDEAYLYQLDVWTEMLVDNTYELMISAYVEGSSYNKYIAICNATGGAIDLTDYSLQLFANGALIPSNVYDLTGTFPDDSVMVFKNSGASLYKGEAIVSSICNFNGNDAVVLAFKGGPIDVVGYLNDDSSWGENVTLYRNADVLEPNYYDEEQWSEHPMDDTLRLGTYAFDGATRLDYLFQDSAIMVPHTSLFLQDLADDMTFFYSVQTMTEYGCRSEESNHISYMTPEDVPTAEASVPDLQVKVFAMAGHIVVQVEGIQALHVYDVTGTQVASGVMSDEHIIAVNSGIYLVRVADKVMKVVVR